jgi:hypothetical protein
LCVFVAAFFILVNDTYYEINAATGATRTKHRYGFLITTNWKVTPTWMSESAERQGIDIRDSWQLVSRHSFRVVSEVNACGRAPKSFLINLVDPSAMSKEEADRFVREFVKADEQEREAMIRCFVDGE